MSGAEGVKMVRMRLDPICSDIWNCEKSLEFHCPQQWNKLTTTTDPAIRHCSICDQDVFMCSSAEEFIKHARMGQCVAIPRKAFITGWLGRPSKEEVHRLEAEKALARAWWTTVMAAGLSVISPVADQLRKAFSSKTPDQ